MQRNAARLTLLTLCAVACSCVVVAVALAATTVSTKRATKVTATTADLHGVIDTGGAAVTWQFEFTKTGKFVAGRGTPVESIPAGKGSVAVTRTAVKLSPGTLYSYRLVAITSHAQRINGNVMTFRTKSTGKLLLTSRKLHVVGGVVSATFKCASTLSCKSRYTITTNATLNKTKTVATITCATTKPFFTIAPGKTGTVSTPVKSSCMTLLSKAKKHTISAKLQANPQTLQQAAIEPVKLTLG